MSKGLQPFSWYGGKLNWLNFILPSLPPRKRYVEPFGGSASVLMNREPAEIEVLNDKNGEVMNFFRVLRNQPDELIESLERTPYHEGEHREAGERRGDPDLDDLERARLFFIRCTMSFNSCEGNIGGFAYSTTESRRNRPQHVSRYESKVDQLEAVAERLQRVQFFHRDALEVLNLFDGDDTLIYLDPPYPAATRKRADQYVHDLGADQHQELLDAVIQSDADVAISTYRCDLYDGLLLSGWNRLDSEERGTGSIDEDTERTESLYVNYTVPTGGFHQRNTQGQASIDGFTS